MSIFADITKIDSDLNKETPCLNGQMTIEQRINKRINIEQQLKQGK